MFSENVGKSLYLSGKKVKTFNQASGIKTLVAGGGILTTWFVRDFMLKPGTCIDGWQ